METTVFITGRRYCWALFRSNWESYSGTNGFYEIYYKFDLDIYLNHTLN